jgi:predicted secreted protein
MAAIAGVGGKVTQGGTTVLNMTDWSLDLGGDNVDTTSFGASGSWKAKVGTVKGWSAKCNGNFDGADTTGQQVLTNGLLSSFTMAFYVDATHNFSGSAILVGIVPKANAAGLVTMEYSFIGNGACTYA